MTKKTEANETNANQESIQADIKAIEEKYNGRLLASLNYTKDGVFPIIIWEDNQPGSDNNNGNGGTNS